MLACWYTSWDGKWHSKWGQEYEQQELLEHIAEADFIVAQNAKFELGWLDRCGMDLHDILCYDTMLAEWVLAGNRPWAKSLGAMLERRGLKGKEDVVAGMIGLGIDPVNIPRPMLKYYCLEDVRGTLELFLIQREELAAQRQLHLVYSRCLLTPVLTDMEKQGVTLDREEVIEEYYKVQKEYDEVQAKLQSFGTINYNSKPQVAKLLYEDLGFAELVDRRTKQPSRTDGGKPRTDSVTLSALVPRTAKQKDFLATYNRLAKLSAKLSKTLHFFREVVLNRNGTFYGILNQGSTGTHRLSSSGRAITTAEGDVLKAQLQNMPREYKRLIKAMREGWLMWEADGSQLEFRVAVDMGHDKQGYDDISNEVDIHSATAAALTEAGEPTDRQSAKSRTFRPLYGGSSGTDAEQAYCQFFRDKYNELFLVQSGWTYDVLRDKKLRTPYGMIFYWPDTKVTRSGYITNTTSIFNYPVQGFATAEIIPIVLVYLWHRLRDSMVRFVLTIHDSVALEVAPDVDAARLRDIIARAFTEDVYEYLEKCYGYRFHVPLGCEIKAGVHLGEGKGVKCKMYNDGNKQLIWS